MTWKINEEGHIELKDGNPIYVAKDGSESTIGVDTISRLNNEAKEHREAKQAALEKLKMYEGIDDPVAARKAIETISKLDAKQLIDAGKVDEVKNQITQQFQTQLTEKEKAIQEYENKYNNLVINHVFANSEFVRDGVAVPRDMFEATFRKNFKIEDGKVSAFDKDGNRIYSREKTGEYADPEEALKILVDSHPQKEVILRANLGNGTGNKGGAGGQGQGRITRSQFEQLTPAEQTKVSGQILKGELKWG